ncbi:unnamed protein product [Peronospora destructor]|uniref:Uncharacterized protein n=1 Tax=Peronospora destructor TaxID=86335 RepID=A0AAV0T9M6_9STRA|nr:unnamed protein product [Peronospora destructor]
MVHKRLCGRNASSLSKPGVVRNANVSTGNSTYIQSTLIAPTSTTAPPLATLMQFADFFVDPSSRLANSMFANANQHPQTEAFLLRSQACADCIMDSSACLSSCINRYYQSFVRVLEVSELLAASWQRLLAFVVEYRILDEVFVRKVYDYVVQIVSSS